MFNWRFLGLFLCLSTTGVASHPEEREYLYNIFGAEGLSRALHFAVKFHVAEYLQEGEKSIWELSDLTGVEPQFIGRILRVLAAQDIFEESHPNYFCHTSISELLKKSHPESLYSTALFYGDEVHYTLNKLLKSAKEGALPFETTFQQTAQEYLDSHPERQKIWRQTVSEKQKTTLDFLIDHYDFSPYQTIYAIAKDKAPFLSRLKEIHPELNITYLKAGHPIPTGGDLYLLKFPFESLGDEKALELLKLCQAALNDKSRLLMIESLLCDDILSTSADLINLVTTGKKALSPEQITDLLQEAGLMGLSNDSTPTEYRLITARKN